MHTTYAKGCREWILIRSRIYQTGGSHTTQVYNPNGSWTNEQCTPDWDATSAHTTVCVCTEGEIVRAVVIDPKNSLWLADAKAEEGEDLVFTLRVLGVITETMTVLLDYNSGSAAQNKEYFPSSTPILFAPGETEKTFTVRTADLDTLKPGNKSFTVTARATGAEFALKDTGVGTILYSATESPSKSPTTTSPTHSPTRCANTVNSAVEKHGFVLFWANRF